MSPAEIKDGTTKESTTPEITTPESTTKASVTKREIAVEIPVEDVNRQTDTLIQKYQKVARIPGFRRGHVPASIIRQRFSEEIKTDMVEALVPRFFRREAERLSLHPVSQPRVTDLRLHEGEPLRFKAAFEVLPEIKLEGYKELRADKPEIAVSEADVEQALADLRERHASFNPVEGRALADGDFAQVSLDGNPKAEQKSGEKIGEGSPAKASLFTWMKCWSKSPARTPCRNSPNTCAGRSPEMSGPST